MPGPKAVEIELTEIGTQGLNKLVKGRNTGQQIALRARIILAAGQGKSNAEIGRELEVSTTTVRLWRKRWHLLHPIPLEELPRPGAPARITADQRCQIEALACEKPEASERPISHWTNREIADELIKRQIVEQISSRHAGRL